MWLLSASMCSPLGTLDHNVRAQFRKKEISIERDNEGHFILVTGKIHLEEMSILNIHAPNTRALSYVKEMLLKLKSYIKPHILLVGDFNPLLSPPER